MGFGLIYLLFLYKIRHARPRVFVGSFLVLIFICLLPAFHNLYFGGQFEIFPTSKNIPENVIIAPLTALKTLGSADTRNTLITQELEELAGLVKRHPISPGLKGSIPTGTGFVVGYLPLRINPLDDAVIGSRNYCWLACPAPFYLSFSFMFPGRITHDMSLQAIWQWALG